MKNDVEAAESLSASKTLHVPQAGVPVGLYVLFFLSGISGLMYEVVWVRLADESPGKYGLRDLDRSGGVHGRAGAWEVS